MTPSKILTCTAILLSLSSSSLLNAQSAAGGNHPRAVVMMNLTDTDGDGKFSKAEYLARAKSESQLPKLEKGFKMFDKDKNGFVTYAELNARFAKVDRDKK